MAKQYPGQFGRSPLYSNPEGTLPLPSPKEVPRPQWYGARMPFVWVPVVVDEAPAPVGILYIYEWTSPVYDLRPDLRSANASPKTGVPIWSSASRLYVQVTAPSIDALPFPSPISVLSTEFAQTTNAQQQRRLGEGAGVPPNVQSIGSANVTGAFATTSGGQQSVLAGFSPPGTTLGFGDGYPVRYWRLKLKFSWFVETGVPVPTPIPPAPQVSGADFLPSLQGAYY